MATLPTSQPASHVGIIRYGTLTSLQLSLSLAIFSVTISNRETERNETTIAMMFRISLSLQGYHEGKRKEEEENLSGGTDIAGHFQTPTAFWVGLLAHSHSKKSFIS